MEERIITFTADEQGLVKTGGISHYASDTISYIKAVFTLGENWQGFDEVRAVFKSPYECRPAVLDSNGECYVPVEVLFYKGKVRVNLVGSIVTETEVTDRLTTYSVEALDVDEDVPICGEESQPISPSQYEQFVANVKADADRAETGADEAEASAQSASESATASADSATSSAQSATASAQSAQNASESAQSAENAKDDAEDARDEILGMRATAETLEAGSDATASYSDGLLTLGIPRGDKGEQGIQGETGATPNFSIGDVDTLEPNEPATATITGTAENPVLNLGLPKGDTGEVSLEDLEALLPTETASGEIVTITDGQSVVPAKSLKVALEPIQDLHGYDKPWVGGAGKNLAYLEQGSLSLSSGVEESSATRVRTNFIPIEQATSYIASSQNNGWSIRNGVAYDENKGYITYNAYPDVATGKFITNDPSIKYVRFIYSHVNTSEECTPSDYWYQFEKGTTATDYEPYSNICPISGHTECVTEVRGVNVWDEEWEVGDITDGVDNPASNRIRSKGYISVVSNTTYYLKCPDNAYLKIFYYGEDKSYIGSESDSRQNTTVQTPNDCHFMRFGTWRYGNTYNHDISINYPSTDHDYHAYNGHTYTTTLGRTVYGGEVEVVGGSLTDKMGMVDLGTLNWVYANSEFSTTGTPSGIKLNMGYAPEGLCSIFEVTNWQAAGDQILFFANNGRVYVHDSSHTDVASFKTAVTGQTLVYAQETPQTYQLTPQEVQLLLGTNNVWSDGDVTLVYNADIQRYIDKKLNA